MSKQQRGGIIRRCVALLRSKWKLQDEVRELRLRLELRGIEIDDLNNRLEAYKDALGALSRGFQLEGMLHQTDLDKISQRKDARISGDVRSP